MRVRNEYVRHCAPLHRNWIHTKAQAVDNLQLLGYPVHMYAGVSMTPTCRPPIYVDYYCIVRITLLPVRMILCMEFCECVIFHFTLVLCLVFVFFT